MRATLIALACLGPTFATAQQAPAPIIDMHLHAGPADAQGPPPVRMCAPFHYLPTRDPQQSPEEYAATVRQQRECRTLLMSAGTNAELLEQTVEVLKRRNIYAVTSGGWDWVQRWHAAAPDRIIRGLGFHVYNAPLDSVRQLVETGQLRVLGEVMNQYVGVAPGDSLFEPYLALAEDRDIPWPQAIERAIEAVESAPFLSSDQKRDIFYNNAARFLRLSEDEVARHHGRRPDRMR